MEVIMADTKFQNIKPAIEWVKTAVIIAAVSATISAYYTHKYDEAQTKNTNALVQAALKSVSPAPVQEASKN